MVGETCRERPVSGRWHWNVGFAQGRTSVGSHAEAVQSAVRTRQAVSRRMEGSVTSILFAC